ncbi:MAG: signal peptide peptidase SppA, partial [Acidobacteriota bacterium]
RSAAPMAAHDPGPNQAARKGPLAGCLAVAASVFRGIDLSRRIVFDAIFLFILFAFLAAAAGGPAVIVPQDAALVVAPQGLLVEELSGDPVERALAEALDQPVLEVLVQDVVDAIVAAKDDDRIQALYLDVGGLFGGGLDKLHRIRAAILDFKAAGKSVIAVGDGFEKTGYLLASAADEIHLNPMGIVLLDGYGRFRMYHHEGIERLGIDWNVFKVGDFKSAVEPFLRDDMSDEAEEANLAYLDDLWDSYLETVSEARGRSVDELRSGIVDLTQQLTAVDGDTARLALDSGLVDQLSDRIAIRSRMAELVAADDDGFRQIDMDDYLEAIGDARYTYPQAGEGVAVVVASGTILDGDHPPGTIGGDSTARLIRRAREDANTKAIVLRVDSGGGSAFASEVIRNELATAQADGLPVVVSMGTLAASGGYWISTSSDEIWASPDTLTGSIGIFGMFPTYQRPLAEHLGTRVDGVGTTWLAGALRPDRALDPRAGDLIQKVIDKGYEDFLVRVADAREMTTEAVDDVAQGRIWSGEDAHERGLVDQLGDLDQAIASAARLAELGDGYAVRTVAPELDPFDQLLVDLTAGATAHLGPTVGQVLGRLAGFDPPRTELERRLFDIVEAHREMLGQFNDPFGVYAHCLCEVE